MARDNRQATGDNPGYVYLLNRDDGLHKIGHTVSLSIRLDDLRHASKWRATLVWSLHCADRITTERALHTRFREQHIGQEWFDLSVGDVAWLTRQTEATICASYDPSRFIRLDAWTRRHRRGISETPAALSRVPSAPPTGPMRMGVRLGEVMRQLGVDERELHARSGVSRNTIRALSRDVVTRIDLDILDELARALGVHPLELLYDA